MTKLTTDEMQAIRERAEASVGTARRWPPAPWKPVEHDDYGWGWLVGDGPDDDSPDEDRSFCGFGDGDYDADLAEHVAHLVARQAASSADIAALLAHVDAIEADRSGDPAGALNQNSAAKLGAEALDSARRLAAMSALGPDDVDNVCRKCGKHYRISDPDCQEASTFCDWCAQAVAEESGPLIAALLAHVEAVEQERDNATASLNLIEDRDAQVMHDLWGQIETLRGERNSALAEVAESQRQRDASRDYLAWEMRARATCLIEIARMGRTQVDVDALAPFTRDSSVEPDAEVLAAPVRCDCCSTEIHAGDSAVMFVDEAERECWAHYGRCPESDSLRARPERRRATEEGTDHG